MNIVNNYFQYNFNTHFIHIFSNELNTFNTWMESAYRTLEDKEVALSKVEHLSGQSDDVREFVSDVIAHQADLRFITMAAQKFVDESKVLINY